jgi:hypothetical protein
MKEVVGRGGEEGEEILEMRLAEEFGAFGGLVASPSAWVHQVIVQQLAADQGETLGLAWLKAVWP